MRKLFLFFNIILCMYCHSASAIAASKDYFLIPLIYQKQILDHWKKVNAPTQEVNVVRQSCIYLALKGGAKGIFPQSSTGYFQGLSKCYLYLNKPEELFGDNELRTIHEVMKLAIISKAFRSDTIDKDRYESMKGEILIDDVLLEKILKNIDKLDIEKEFVKYKIEQPFRFETFPEIDSEEFRAVIKHMFLKEEKVLEILFFYSGYFVAINLTMKDADGNFPNGMSKEDVAAKTLIFLMENWDDTSKISAQEVHKLNLYFSAKLKGYEEEAQKYAENVEKFKKLIKNEVFSIDLKAKVQSLNSSS